jgi:hypothetical protein
MARQLMTESVPMAATTDRATDSAQHEQHDSDHEENPADCGDYGGDVR